MCCRVSSADDRLAVIDQYAWQEILVVRNTTVIAIISRFCVSCIYMEQVEKIFTSPKDYPMPSDKDSHASILFR